MSNNAKIRKRRHRNQNTEIRHQGNRLMTPSSIPVADFVEHHQEEMLHLQSALIANQPPPDGRPNLLPVRGRGFIDSKGRRQFQTLPRHLRRRSASYNLYRIPQRLRARARMEVIKAAQDDSAVESIADRMARKPHRHHKRRPKYLRMDYARRHQSTGIRWLETHLWARKRMHLESHWGYYVPMRMTDKGNRAAYKNSAYVVTLHDASYYECLQVHGSMEELKQFVHPDHGMIRASTSDPFHSYAREQSGLVFSHDGQLIGPVRFLPVQGKEEVSLMIWLHPAIYEDVQKAIEQYSSTNKTSLKSTSRRGEFVRYELYGPRANLLLQSLLRVTERSDDYQKWKSLSFLRTCAELPDRVVLSLEVEDPRAHFPPPAAKKVLSQKQAPSPVDLEKVSQLVAHWPASSSSTSPFWTYEHDPSAPVPSATPIPILLIQRPGGERSYEPALDDTKQHNKHLGSGWDLIVPRHCGMAFWRSLVFAGARVMGLNSRRQLELERGSMSFPLDFIDTQAGQNLLHQQFAEERRQYERKPPSKRVNYAKLNSIFPWKIDWMQLLQYWQSQGPSTSAMSVDTSVPHVLHCAPKQIADWLYNDQVDSIPPHVWNSLVTVRVQMKKGTPLPSGCIVFPTDKDLALARTNPDAISLQAESLRRTVTSRPDLDETFSFTSPSRRVMGFITSGGHVYSHGSGAAIGTCSFIALYLLRQLCDQRDEDLGTLLIRNSSSRHYHVASFSLPLSHC